MNTRVGNHLWRSGSWAAGHDGTAITGHGRQRGAVPLAILAYALVHGLEVAMGRGLAGAWLQPSDVVMAAALLTLSRPGWICFLVGVPVLQIGFALQGDRMGWGATTMALSRGLLILGAVLLLRRLQDEREGEFRAVANYLWYGLTAGTVLPVLGAGVAWVMADGGAHGGESAQSAAARHDCDRGRSRRHAYRTARFELG